MGSDLAALVEHLHQFIVYSHKKELLMGSIRGKLSTMTFRPRLWDSRSISLTWALGSCLQAGLKKGVGSRIQGTHTPRIVKLIINGLLSVGMGTRQCSLGQHHCNVS